MTLGLGEVLGAHVDLGGVRPGERGWTAAMLAAMPAAAGERVGLYQDVFAVPPDAARAEPALGGRFAATTLAWNASFHYLARVDAAHWLCGIKQPGEFARAAIERIAAMPIGTPAPSPLPARWGALVTASADLFGAYYRYQEVLPPAAMALPPERAKAAQQAAGVAHHRLGEAMDALAVMANADAESSRARGAALAAALEGVAEAVPDPGARDAIGGVRAAAATWSEAAGAFEDALRAGRTTARERGAARDQGDERWETTAVLIAQAREGLALMRGCRGTWRGASLPAIDAEVARFEKAIVATEDLYGALDAAAAAVAF